MAHPSGLILNAFALMPLRASSRCSLSKMQTHLVELGVRISSPVDANKKPQLKAEVWYLVHPEGFEPPTKWFEATYSIQLSYGCWKCIKCILN